MKNKIIQWLRWLIAPTLYISDHYKGRATSLVDRGRRVKKLNKTYFTISVVSGCLLSLAAFYKPNSYMTLSLMVVLCCYCLSRCNEIFMAFVKDVFDKLTTIKREKNGLEYFERIQLALRSYVELVMNYAILYYVLDTYGYMYLQQSKFFNQPLNNLFNALYFSVVTIVSIGYGDYVPTHPITKLLVVYEVVNGMVLLVVSFTVYVTLTLKE